MKMTTPYRILIAALFCLYSFQSLSQITGPTPVGLKTYTYYFDNGSIISPKWIATKGTVGTRWSSGTTFYVNITLTSTGSGGITLQDLNSGNTMGTKTVTINSCSTITAPVSNNGSNCGPGTVNISVNTPSGYFTRWYTGTTSYLIIISDDNNLYTTPSLSSTTTYNATFANGTTGCESARTTVTANIITLPTTSVAGSNQAICGLVGKVLAANAPSVGTGAWSIVSGPSTLLSQFSSATSPTATFTPAGGTGSYVLKWTITNSTCTSASNVTLTFNALPTTSNAGPTQTGPTTCGLTTVTLAANTPTVGTGLWSIAPDSPTTTGGSFGNTSSPTSSFTGTAGATYGLAWTITNASCSSVSEVNITFRRFPTAAATANPTVCTSSTATITLSNPNNVSGTTYSWTVQINNAEVPSATSGNSITGTYHTSDGITQGSAVYTITPSANGCNGSPITATVTINSLPVMPSPQSFVGYMDDNPVILQLVVPQGKQANWYADNTTTSPFNTTSSMQVIANQGPFYNAFVSLKDNTTQCESSRAVFSATFLNKLSVPPSVTQDVVRLSGKTTDPSIDALNSSSQKTTSISFFDGLARSSQKIVLSAAPSGKDLVQAVDYDSYGHISRNYLPYSATTGGTFQFSFMSDQSAFYQATGDKIADDSYPYSTTTYELSPLGRPLVQGSVGQAWQPGNHPKTISYSYNTGASANDDNVEEVRKFTSTGASAGFYPANNLSKVTVTDENSHKDYIFKNAIGKTVVRKQQLDTTINGTMVHYLQTYYVYDTLYRLKYIIPPAGQAALKSAGWGVPSQNIIDQHFHQFVYDNRGRLTQKKTPGQAWTFYCYDKLNRLVLTQDGNLRPLNKWAFIKYDQLGRAVVAGLYTNNTQIDISTVQTTLNNFYNGTNPYYEIRSAAANGYSTANGYSNQSFPTFNADNSALEVLSVNYYDNYDFNFDGTGAPDYTYDNANLAGLPALSGLYVRTAPTGNMKLILGSTNWLKSVVFYDNYGRVIQSQSNNHLNLTVTDKSSVIYDFEGKPTKAKNYHNPGANPVTIVQTPVYDAIGRTTGINHNINASSDQLVAQYQYNELSQLVTKQLHGTGGTFLQNVDYRYNIRGWLSSINNAQLSSDGGLTNNDTNDYFGMELMYNTTDALGNTAYYNGNVSAVKWKGMSYGSGTAGERSYKFAYDKTDKLLAATFQKYGTAAWDQEQNTLNETMSYDHNGNILALQRNQNQRGLQVVNSIPTVTATVQPIDNLTYTYATGNQLSKVADASGSTAGFNDGANATTEYTYDPHGNLTADQNKGITGITYNVFGKPNQITITTGGVTKVINYTYDASGTKLKMATTISGTTTTTDYVNGFVYTNGTLNFFSSPEGRVLKNGSAFEYQYAITDHQGNTRVLFTSATQTPVSTIATFGGDPGDQSGQFSNVAPVVTYTAANHTSGGSKVVQMSPSYPVGPALSKKVFAGDKIDMNVWSYYEGSSGYGSNVSAASMITAVATAFGGVPNAPDYTGQIYSGVNNAIGIFGLGANPGSTQPAAFLNYILFDQNYKVMDMGWMPAPAGAFVQNHIVFPTVTAKEAGYIFVYLSYEDQSGSNMYFDDLNVAITPTNVIQSNEYYPFGLQTSNSWTRDNTTNNFLYDAGNELNTTSGFYDLPYRNYDAALGRFFQIDPMSLTSHNLTPYHYAGNNPIGSNDPSGLTRAYYANPGDDPRNWRMNVHGDPNSMNDPNTEGGIGEGGGDGGSNWGDDHSVAPSAPDGPSSRGTPILDDAGNVIGFHFEGAAAQAVLSAAMNGMDVVMSTPADGQGSVSVGFIMGASQGDPGNFTAEMRPIIGNTPDYRGVFIRATYNPSKTDNFSDYNWIFWTNNGHGAYLNIDPNNFVNEGPFYYGEPGRPSLSDNSIYDSSEIPTMNFMGIMTLYGKQGDNWVQIGSVEYGFSYSNGNLNPIVPPVITYSRK